MCYFTIQVLQRCLLQQLYIRQADGDNDVMLLGAGEFAFFPWSATHDLYADAATGTPVLEVRLYQTAA